MLGGWAPNQGGWVGEVPAALFVRGVTVQAIPEPNVTDGLPVVRHSASLSGA